MLSSAFLLPPSQMNYLLYKKLLHVVLRIRLAPDGSKYSSWRTVARISSRNAIAIALPSVLQQRAWKLPPRNYAGSLFSPEDTINSPNFKRSYDR
jgi:hypothetical protein